MERVLHREPAIEYALGLLPPGILRRLGRVPFVTGVDSRFVGLTLNEYAGAPWFPGHPHVAYPNCQPHRPLSERESTIVLPYRFTDSFGPVAVVHELGHVLDERLGWVEHVPDPVNEYAGTNAYEAFAEAFALHFAPASCAAYGDEFPGGRYWPDVLAADHETLALFEELAR